MGVYAQWLKEQNDPAEGAVRSALEAAAALDPSKAARATSLARELGMSETLVMANPDAAEMEAGARRLEQQPAGQGQLR